MGGGLGFNSKEMPWEEWGVWSGLEALKGWFPARVGEWEEGFRRELQRGLGSEQL